MMARIFSVAILLAIATPLLLTASRGESEPIIPSMPYVFLYALSAYDFTALENNQAKVMVIDHDDAALLPKELAKLRSTGSLVLSYLSVGEAEDYRYYWNNWTVGNPHFIMQENPKWKGNYPVKFWDKEWQKIIIRRVELLANFGYDGAYLDIVDAYTLPQLKRSYRGSKWQLRDEMEKFVAKISQAAKAINPNFRIVPQNAPGLLTLEGNPDQPNTQYLRHIDGIGIESLWYSDDVVSDWTKWDLEHIATAQKQGKFVLATSYPTDPHKQAEFLNKAMAQGFIPFVGKRKLSATEAIAPINQQLPTSMPSNWQNQLR